MEALAKTVEDNGGVYFVPAFSGLFAPYWKSDARGVIAGLTRYVNRGHIARAALEATAFQTREVLDAMNADSGVPLKALKVDGGMVYNDLLMQFQADVLGVPVVRPKVAETTALGAAYAAGLAVGFWQNTDEMRANWGMDKTWEPSENDWLAPNCIPSGRKPSLAPSIGWSLEALEFKSGHAMKSKVFDIVIWCRRDWSRDSQSAFGVGPTNCHGREEPSRGARNIRRQLGCDS